MRYLLLLFLCSCATALEEFGVRPDTAADVEAAALEAAEGFLTSNPYLLCGGVAGLVGALFGIRGLKRRFRSASQPDRSTDQSETS